MKILCLHGRGSNNEIFQAQTSAIRSYLDDFSFEFVQGTELHTEGNWSLFTKQFSQLPQFAYYNPLNPGNVLQAETDLLEVLEEEGPFDGVLGYSGGAALAAQVIVRHQLNSPTADPLFRFAIFINGGTPLKAFALSDETIKQGDVDTSALDKELEDIYLRPSNMRVRKGDNKEEAEKAIEARKKEIEVLSTGQLADGRYFISDGKVGVTRYEGSIDGPLVDIPTLNIRCAEEQDDNLGLNLLNICHPAMVKEFHHRFGHDFPSGAEESRKIAEAIIDLTEGA